jgi:hypothetical protein
LNAAGATLLHQGDVSFAAVLSWESARCFDEQHLKQRDGKLQRR